MHRWWLLLGVLALMVTPLPGQPALTPMEPSLGRITGVPTNAPYYGNLVVRDGPDQSSQIIGHVTNGDEVTVEGQQGYYLKVSSPKSGWVWASYVLVTEEKPKPKPNAEPWSLDEVISTSKPLTAGPDPKGIDAVRSRFDEKLQKEFEQSGSP